MKDGRTEGIQKVSVEGETEGRTEGSEGRAVIFALAVAAFPVIIMVAAAVIVMVAAAAGVMTWC